MKFNIKHVAKLANLHITSVEETRLASQLSDVLDYVKQLSEVDTTDIPPTSQVTGLENVIRKDLTHQSLSQNDALANAKNKLNGLFQVKGILDNE